MNKEFLCVEEPFVELLEDLGWEKVVFTDDSPKFVPQLTLRNSFDGVLLEERLRASLKKLNSWLDEEQVEEAINEIKRIGLRKSLVQANIDFLQLVLEPPAFKNRRNSPAKNESIRIIDFEHPKENDFLAINQFRVDTPGTLRDYIVPDIVLFVNGIPFVVIECKYPDQLDVDAMEEGITQLKRYSNTREDVFEREGNERLFHYNQIMISTAFDEARAGTITSEYDHYLEWKDTYPTKLNEKWSSQERLIRGALTKENLLDLIRNFTVFRDSEKGKIKLVARYHQFRAVNKIVYKLLTKKTAAERSGIVWHTQGSGKSYSMVYLIKKIRTLEDLKKYKVVIITDRSDLQTQLSERAVIAEKPYLVKDTDELIEELKTDTSNLLMIMAQKFLKRGEGRVNKDALPEYQEFQILNRSENILVLVDEAHRTQTGIFGDNIVYSLPNSSRIAFTGTPLIAARVKKKTFERFGGYIDKYGMKESIDDGATLSIRYEGKTVKTKIKDPAAMEAAFEDMFAEKTKDEIAAIKKKYGTTGEVLEAEKRIEKIANDIVKHYFENVFDNGFKAQVVAHSRLASVRYKHAIDRALKDYIEEYEKKPGANPERLRMMKFLKTVVRIIWENNDHPEMIRLAKEAKLSLGDDNINFKKPFNLKKPETGIAFLIVTDMLLTGFDAPVEQVMYVDKRMTDHTLLQAIARVNRVANGKDIGYVVDYFGITNHLKEALEVYEQEDLNLQDDVFTDVNSELPRLKYRYEQILKLFKGQGVAKIEEYVNYRIKDVGDQLVILEQCLDVLEDVDKRADFSVKFRLFLRSMDMLLSKPASRPYIPPLKAFGHIHNRAQYRFRDDSINILGAGRKVRRLIDEYLISLGIDTKIPPVDIVTDAFEKEVKKNKSKKAQASEMEHAIRKHCKVMLHKDPIYYKKISEKLEEILKRYEDNWEQQVLFLEQLREEIRQGRKAEEGGLDPVRYAPFYDMLLDIAYAGKKPAAKDEDKTKKLIMDGVDAISLEISKVGFWGNAQKEKHLRAILDDMLLYSDIDPMVESKEKIVSDFMKLAKSRTDELKI